MDIWAVVQRLDPEQIFGLDRLLTADIKWEGRWQPHPDNKPQCRAADHFADVLGFGGEPGGGKSALICGLAVTRHWRSVLFRRIKKHTTDLEEQLIRFAGTRRGFNGEQFNLPDGRHIDIAGVKNIGDEKGWMGIAHDFKAFDQVEQFTEDQFRFLCGWLRTPRRDQRTRIIATMNPPIDDEGRWILKYWGPWIDPTHPKPAKDGELRWYVTVDRNGEDVDIEVGGPIPVDIDGARRWPLSRTFIHSKVEDNPYIGTEKYKAVLGNLPSAVRELMEGGDFGKARHDHPRQVIPSNWVDMAMDRWRNTPKPTCAMTALSVDVARGGKDKTVVTPRWANWIGQQRVAPGKDTPDGQPVVELVIEIRQDDPPVLIDMGGGYGGSPKDILTSDPYNIPVIGLNGAEACKQTDKSGKLQFINKRAYWSWYMREALDPETGDGLCLPPDRELKADLCSLRWKVNLRGIQVDSKEEIIARLGRSPDKGDGAIYSIAEIELATFGEGEFSQVGTETEKEFSEVHIAPWDV